MRVGNRERRGRRGCLCRNTGIEKGVAVYDRGETSSVFKCDSWRVHQPRYGKHQSISAQLHRAMKPYGYASIVGYSQGRALSVVIPVKERMASIFPMLEVFKLAILPHPFFHLKRGGQEWDSETIGEGMKRCRKFVGKNWRLYRCPECERVMNRESNLIIRPYRFMNSQLGSI
jgi:hypothetical protein